MSTSISIRIKTVLLRPNFSHLSLSDELCRPSSVNIRQAKILLQEHSIAFVKLVRWRIVNVLEDHQQLQKKKSIKFLMFVRANPTQVFELLQLLGQFDEQQHVES